MRFFYPTALLLCSLTSATWASDPVVEEPPKQKRKSSLVLVVDDDKVALLLTQAQVRKKSLEAGLDVNVQAILDPKEALELASREKFDVIVTDFNMPGMNGKQLARGIQQLSLGNDGEGLSPRFVLNTTDEEVVRSLTPGLFDAVIMKKPREVGDEVVKLVQVNPKRNASLFLF